MKLLLIVAFFGLTVASSSDVALPCIECGKDLFGCDATQTLDKSWELHVNSMGDSDQSHPTAFPNVFHLVETVHGLPAFTAQFEVNSTRSSMLTLSHAHPSTETEKDWPIKADTHFLYRVAIKESQDEWVGKLFYLNGFDTCSVKLDAFASASNTHVLAFHITGT